MLSLLVKCVFICYTYASDENLLHLKIFCKMWKNLMRDFMFFTAVKIQVEVFWVVMPCGFLGYQHFGGPVTSLRWTHRSPKKCWFPTATPHDNRAQKCPLKWKNFYLQLTGYLELLKIAGSFDVVFTCSALSFSCASAF